MLWESIALLKKAWSAFLAKIAMTYKIPPLNLKFCFAVKLPSDKGIFFF